MHTWGIISAAIDPDRHLTVMLAKDSPPPNVDVNVPSVLTKTECYLCWPPLCWFCKHPPPPIPNKTWTQWCYKAIFILQVQWCLEKCGYMPWEGHRRRENVALQVQGSWAQCECTLTELLALTVSYSNNATIPTGITVPHRCWHPCASEWSPYGWKAATWAPAWGGTAPTVYAEQSPFSCPSDVPGFNKRNKSGHQDASEMNALNVNTAHTCTDKQRMQFCFRSL